MRGTTLPEASILPADHVLTDINGHSSSLEIDNRALNSADLSYIQIGDWEKPDILLLVENTEWLDSIEKIVDAARADRVPVYILSDAYDLENEDYLSWLKDQKEARSLKVSYDTPWIRDYGPLQVRISDKTVHWLDSGYTMERPHDDLVPRQIARYMEMPIEDSGYYLEGGALINNGKGLCAVTVMSLEQASVDWTDTDEFAAFQRALGCHAVAVLPALTDETTGHADIIAQFLAPDVVVVSKVDRRKSPTISDELQQSVNSLVMTARAVKQPLRVVRLPMHVEGEKFYSYVNGTRLRKIYLAPSYSAVPEGMEQDAYRTIQSVLPEIKLFAIPADNIVKMGGAVHCITLGLSLSRSADTPGNRLTEDNFDRLKPVLSSLNLVHTDNTFFRKVYKY